MLTCEECGHKVSATASQCPGCGSQHFSGIVENRRRLARLFRGGAVLVLCGYLLSFWYWGAMLETWIHAASIVGALALWQFGAGIREMR